jgi:acetyltransferase
MLAIASIMESNATGERTGIQVELHDGTLAELRPLTADDRDLLLEGLSRLSEESRFARFGSGRSHLQDSEIRYLTDVDQVSHVAWGATIDGHAAGVGRYIAGDGASAEIAVTVVDRYQRIGLGRALFDALIASARAGGVGTLWFSIQPWNRAVIEMMREFEVRYDEAEGMLSGRIAVDDVPPGERDAEFVHLLDRFRRR